jgi:hypothetical protein
MQTNDDYIYYSCAWSTSNIIWEAEVERYLREKKKILGVFQQAMRMDLKAAFAPIHRGFRLVQSGALPIANVDSDGHGAGSIGELHEELSWVSKHLDSIWPGSNGMVASDHSTVKLLTRTSFEELINALDFIAHETKESPCKWIFHFDGKDHALLLPRKALIRAYEPRRLTADPSEGSDRTDFSLADQSGSGGSGSGDRFGADTSQSGDYEDYNQKTDEPMTDPSLLKEKVKKIFRVVKILGPDQFLSSNNERVKVYPTDLKGRTVGDELIVYMPSSPNAIIDLTGGDVLKEWQS